jgi:cobalamin synthase
MSDDKRAGMQRIRVGLTGLGAVMLIVAISAAIFESASNQPGNGTTAPLDQTEQTVANMVTANGSESPSEPLAEIGVTPGTPANNAQDSK